MRLMEVLQQPQDGQQMGTRDGGEPEKYNSQQLSAAADLAHAASKVGLSGTDIGKRLNILCPGISPEMTYSNWKYVSQK